MKISLTVNDRRVTAKLADSEVAREFASFLPLTLNMSDLFGREKFAQLPRPLSAAGKHTYHYSLGEIAYWPPGPDVALFYRHDGEAIPDPGIIKIGRVTSDIDALNVRGPVTVRFELLDQGVSDTQLSITPKLLGAR
jgi:hypothetical protein